MARIRSVHPDICTSETMAELSAELERTFVRLWTHCDDDGRCVDNALLLKAALYPLHVEVTGESLELELQALARAQLIDRYEVDGRRYLSVRSWGEFQHPQRKTDSKLPPAPEPSPTPPAILRDTSATPPRALHAGEGGGEGEVDGGGEGALAPRDGARKPDPVWDALLAVCGVTAELTKTERGRFNAAAKELRDAGATASEIRRRAAVFRGKWPTITLTPNGLAGRWGECERNGTAGLSPAAARLMAIGEPR